MATVEELRAQFAGINVADNVALLTWLKEMFEACASAQVELPGRRQVASRIGRARMLLPNPELPDFAPPGDKLTWLLTLSINTLITADTAERQASLYGITAFAIDSWLMAQQGETR